LTFYEIPLTDAGRSAVASLTNLKELTLWTVSDEYLRKLQNALPNCEITRLQDYRLIERP
jgi:hypothetical protein